MLVMNRERLGRAPRERRRARRVRGRACSSTPCQAAAASSCRPSRPSSAASRASACAATSRSPADDRQLVRLERARRRRRRARTAGRAPAARAARGTRPALRCASHERVRHDGRQRQRDRGGCARARRRSTAAIAGAQEVKVARRNLEARHVADAMEAEDRSLERATGVQPRGDRVAARRRDPSRHVRPPEPARGRQHVEVRQVVGRRDRAMKRPARFHQRHVERPAVEGHEQASPRRRSPRARRASRARLPGRLRKNCRTRNAVVLEPAAAGEKRERAGAAAETRRLEVEEHDAAAQSGRAPARAIEQRRAARRRAAR